MHYIEIVPHKNENIKKKAPAVQILFAYGVPKRIRTFGLQSRSLTLYPAELRTLMQGGGIRPLFYMLNFSTIIKNAKAKHGVSMR